MEQRTYRHSRSNGICLTTKRRPKALLLGDHLKPTDLGKSRGSAPSDHRPDDEIVTPAKCNAGIPAWLRPAAAVITASCRAAITNAPSTEDHVMKTPHLLIVLAVLAVSASLGIRHWPRDTVAAPTDADRESSLPAASVRDAASRAIAPTPDDTAGIVGTPASGIPSRSPISDTVPREDARSVSSTAAIPADGASSSLDRSGTPDAPGDPEAQPENPSEQFMHSRRGDGQHPE